MGILIILVAMAVIAKLTGWSMGKTATVAGLSFGGAIVLILGGGALFVWLLYIMSVHGQ